MQDIVIRLLYKDKISDEVWSGMKRVFYDTRVVAYAIRVLIIASGEGIILLLHGCGWRSA